MKRRDFLKWIGLAAAGPLVGTAAGAEGGSAKRPNVLFITVDDMSCDSVGVFGCKVPDTTPHIDRMARQGLRFRYAHVQVANCMPSRNVMQSGLYPHTSGVEGFYQVQHDHPLLPGVLKESGYFVGIKNKVGHSTPYSPWAWDLVEMKSPGRGAGRSPKGFYDFTARAIRASREAGKPFYLVVNINDPHKPFFIEPRAGGDGSRPSRVYRENEVLIPAFLPDLPEVRTEIKQYYDTVRRADDSTAAVLKALKDSGREDDTVVMFLSDHGMPFPFAKTNIYHHSTHTPWIVRWPGKVKANSVDAEHMISAIDFMPTVLDIAGVDHPPGLQGRSFLPLLLGKKQSGREMVIKEYNENAGGGRHPMRGVQTKKYGYLFNPWSSGTRRFRTATQGTRTYKRMVAIAGTDRKIAARLRLFDYRTVEEFYDYETDPDALHNLIEDPNCAKEVDRHRKMLEDWMVRTKDPWLDAFRNRDKPEVLEAYMKKLEAASAERRKKRRGKGKKPRKKGLIALAPPGSVSRGAEATVVVRHNIPADLGEQLVHVTIKAADGKRIGRKVLGAKGRGELKVAFSVPKDAKPGQVVFAAFIGKDFPSCLQHVASGPVPVK